MTHPPVAGQRGEFVQETYPGTPIIPSLADRQPSGVGHLDILGCDSSAIGALISTLVPGLTVGSLRGKRFDDFKVDPATMKIQDFNIVPMQIFHFAGK